MILGQEINITVLFVKLAHRKKILSQYSASMKHFALQICHSKELGDHQNDHFRATNEYYCRVLFVGLAHREKFLSHYPVSISHFALQIRGTSKNLEIIKMVSLVKK